MIDNNTKSRLHSVTRPAGTFALLTIAACLLLGMPYVAAAPPASQSVGTMAVNALIGRTSCQITFVQNYLSGLSGVPTVAGSMAMYSASLAQLRSEAAAYSGTGGIGAVQSFVSGKVNPLFSGINSNVSAQLAAFQNAQGRQAYTNALAPTVANYPGLVWNYSSCSLGPYKSLVTAKLGLYETQIAQAENYTNALSSYGINTSSLDAIIAGANSSVIEPISLVAGNSTSSSQLDSLINRYCLNDGCTYHLAGVQGINYHLAARMNIEAAQLIIDKISSSDLNANAAYLAAAQSHINNASAIVQKVGSEAYVGSQGEEIAQNLSAAAAQVKAAVGTVAG